VTRSRSSARPHFRTADPQTIPRGDATVTLRRRGAGRSRSAASRAHRFVVAFTQSRRGIRRRAQRWGDRLTITQPTARRSLTVILFRQSQEIHDRTFPLDTVAVPGAQRVIRILYFSQADLAAFRATRTTRAYRPGAVLSATDDAGDSGHHYGAIRNRGDDRGLHVTVTLERIPCCKWPPPQPYVLAAPRALSGALAWWLTGSRQALRLLRAFPPKRQGHLT